MKMLSKAYVEENKKEIINEIKSGKLFIYPTDTIYGLGCDATNSNSVSKLRILKKRDEKPFSVIPPNVEWISDNCDCAKNKDSKAWIRKLPGSYTLILPLKNKSSVAEEVLVGSRNVGVRIPNNWFTEIVKESGVPFVSTSANMSGQPPMTDFYDLHQFIKEGVDYIIYEGSKNNKPSTIVELFGDKENIITR